LLESSIGIFYLCVNKENHVYFWVAKFEIIRYIP
jgi:hypothetical protein